MLIVFLFIQNHSDSILQDAGIFYKPESTKAEFVFRFCFYLGGVTFFFLYDYLITKSNTDISFYQIYLPKLH